jgi:sortase B
MKQKKEKLTITSYDLPIKNISFEDEPQKRKKKKRRLKKWVLILIIIILGFISSFNILKLLDWSKDNKKTNNNIKEIENTKTEEIKDDENTELISTPDDKESDYWYYITFPLIKVDFTELIKKNEDTVGWINVNNTNINYPVVQSTDNNYYLTHSYDKKENEAGWVFLDYRNNKDFTSKNNIIYAHSRLDKTMFGSLSKILKQSWYKDKSNHIIRLSTPTEDSLWQIFSVYVIKEETYYITTSWSSDTEYLDFLNTIKERSKYNFNTELNTDDKILTLSTCYSDTERTVVHAKLIKRNKR